MEENQQPAAEPAVVEASLEQLVAERDGLIQRLSEVKESDLSVQTSVLEALAATQKRIDQLDAARAG